MLVFLKGLKACSIIGSVQMFGLTANFEEIKMNNLDSLGKNLDSDPNTFDQLLGFLKKAAEKKRILILKSLT